MTNYATPAFKYSVSPGILGENKENLGQSWAEPQLVRMVDGSGNVKDVFLLAGGYDINQDKIEGSDDPPASEDSEGRAVFAVDAQTGALFSPFSFTHDNYSSMTHSIIAVSGFENPQSRTTTRVYAGDLNGNLFAFRDDVFDVNPALDGREDGYWGQKMKLYSVPGKKIWYPPNIVNEYFRVKFEVTGEENDGGQTEVIFQYRVGDYVFFGTGDRAHPERKDILNRFYAIKNHWQWGSAAPTIIEAYVDVDDGGKVKAKSDNRVLVGGEAAVDEWFILDVTEDHYQDNPQNATYIKKAMDHEKNRGWFIRLEEMDGSQVGEKLVSSPIIYAGVIYFTTYIPDDDADYNVDDPCAAPGAGGSGYLYEIGYKYGEAVVNHSLSNDSEDGTVVLGRADRRVKLKNKGIPPQPVLVVHEGKASLIIGFENFEPKYTAGVERAFWRQVNLDANN